MSEPPQLPPPPPLSPGEKAPEPRRFLGRWALLGGIGVGTLAYVIAQPLSFTAGTGNGSFVYLWFFIEIIVSLVVIVAGTVLVAIEKTRLFGAGIFISLAIGLIVGNGVCIALAQSLSA